jgi:periplasmic protein TonB
LSRYLPRATLAALAVETVLLGGAAVYLADNTQATATHQQHVVMLTFPEPPVARPEPPKPKPKPPKPKPPPPKPVHHVEHHQLPKPVPKPNIVQSAPTPQPVAVPLPPAPKPPAPDAAPTVSDAFRTAVREAVQAAMRYPYAARMAHITGKAQVSFSYLDGAVSNVAIAVSSSYHMLDEAAIAAVKKAAYPPPPSKLAGRSLQFVVWVRFYQFDSNQ